MNFNWIMNVNVVTEGVGCYNRCGTLGCIFLFYMEELSVEGLGILCVEFLFKDALRIGLFKLSIVFFSVL